MLQYIESLSGGSEMGTRFFAFEGFELSPQQRRLVRDGRPVRIGSRAFDILVVLAANAGEILTKEELILSVWPDTFVDESSLRVHMSQLRRALDGAAAGRPIIENIPGRGYCFVATLDDAPQKTFVPDRQAVLASSAPIDGKELRAMIERLEHGCADGHPDGVVVLDLASFPARHTVAEALSSTMTLLREGQLDGEALSGSRATVLAFLAIL